MHKHFNEFFKISVIEVKAKIKEIYQFQENYRILIQTFFNHIVQHTKTCLVFGRKSFATKAGIIVISIKFIDGRSGPFAPCAKMHSPTPSLNTQSCIKRLLIAKFTYSEKATEIK